MYTEIILTLLCNSTLLRESDVCVLYKRNYLSESIKQTAFIISISHDKSEIENQYISNNTLYTRVMQYLNHDIAQDVYLRLLSRWKQRITEQQLTDFQQQIGVQFSESLKNYYRTMNGLDKPGLDTCGGEGEVEFGPTFYSYPEDVARIKDYIDWVSEDNHVAKEATNSLVPAVFPYYVHRFLILDEEEKVLSMRGSDIIFWAENLSKGIANDIFSFRSRVELEKVNENSFWNKKALVLEEIRKRSFLNRG